MKPAMALLALFSAACGGSSRGSSGLPTAPTVPTVVTVPPAQVGGQLFTYQNAVAFLPAGIAEYKAAIVFLPGLRDPATGNDFGLAHARDLALRVLQLHSFERELVALRSIGSGW